MKDENNTEGTNPTDYPRLGGYVVASQIAGTGFELTSPLPDLEKLLAHAKLIDKRVAFLTEGKQNLVTELPRVGLIGAIEAFDSLFSTLFRCYSDSGFPPIAIAANHGNYSFESRIALTQLKHCVDQLLNWLTNDRHGSTLGAPPSQILDRLGRCVATLDEEVKRLQPPEGKRLVLLDEVAEFQKVRTLGREEIQDTTLEGIRQLDERTEIEPFLREILSDKTETPHTSTEIADILTTAFTYDGERRLVAFVNKGKSYPSVSAKLVSYQVIRLRQIQKLECMVLLAVGDIQDDLKRDFLQVAKDGQCDYLIADAVDVARLFIAYGKVCPIHGVGLSKENCSKCSA